MTKWNEINRLFCVCYLAHIVARNNPRSWISKKRILGTPTLLPQWQINDFQTYVKQTNRNSKCIHIIYVWEKHNLYDTFWQFLTPDEIMLQYCLHPPRIPHCWCIVLFTKLHCLHSHYKYLILSGTLFRKIFPNIQFVPVHIIKNNA